jgi:hypothetical protein
MIELECRHCRSASVDPVTTRHPEPMPLGFPARLMDHMKALSQPEPAAAKPRPNMKIATKATSHRPQFRKTDASRFRRSNPTTPQNAQKNYERYLALARAEALSGDRVAAENYFQYAEHYLRSMNDKSN